MTDAVKRKVGKDRNGKPVLPSLRVPWEVGTVLWVQTSADTVVVTASEPVTDRERAKDHFASTREVYDAGGGYQLSRPKAVTVEKPEDVSDDD